MSSQERFIRRARVRNSPQKLQRIDFNRVDEDALKRAHFRRPPRLQRVDRRERRLEFAREHSTVDLEKLELQAHRAVSDLAHNRTTPSELNGQRMKSLSIQLYLRPRHEREQMRMCSRKTGRLENRKALFGRRDRCVPLS